MYFSLMLVRRAVAVRVAQVLYAPKYTTPAPCLHPAMPRKWVSLRTPFYALGVYATAHLVQPLLSSRTVVIHRYVNKLFAVFLIILLLILQYYSFTLYTVDEHSVLSRSGNKFRDIIYYSFTGTTSFSCCRVT